MFVIKYRKIFFALSGLLILGSVLSVLLIGFQFSTDFKGGSILEISYTEERPTLDFGNTALSTLNLGNFSLRPAGEKNFVLRAREITPAEKTQIESALSENGKLTIKEERFNSVGPIVGAGLKHKSYIAISIVVLCIVLFVTFAFRKVSEPVASWKFGLATIIALAHDVIIPTGVYIVFGKFFGAEIDLLFITALLAILGYSVHDTIVVFDRVRENLRLNQEYRSKESFEDTVGKSVAQTFGRSINTSLTIFLTLLALLVVGSSSTRDFAFTLLVGVIAGTYSSIFVASPLLVTLEKLQKKDKK
jgi:preprotein translocase subunit SecF